MIAAGAELVLGVGGVGACLASRARGAADTTQLAAAAPTQQAAPAPNTATAKADSAKMTPTTPPVSVPRTVTPSDTAKRVAMVPAPKTAAKDSAPAGASTVETKPAAADSITGGGAIGGRPRRLAREGPEFRVLAEQVNEHFRKALQTIRGGDVPSTRSEFAKAAPIVAQLRQMSAGTPAAAQVEQVVRGSSMQVVKACRDGMADTAARRKFPANFRCELLLPPGLRGQRGARGNPSPPMNR
jgi:hypothetical protein